MASSTGGRLMALDGGRARRAPGLDPADWSGLHAWFVGEHLERWLPPFMQAVRENAEKGGVVAMATDALTAWFENERTTTAAPRRA